MATSSPFGSVASAAASEVVPAALPLAEALVGAERFVDAVAAARVVDVLLAEAETDAWAVTLARICRLIPSCLQRVVNQVSAVARSAPHASATQFWTAWPALVLHWHVILPGNAQPEKGAQLIRHAGGVLMMTPIEKLLFSAGAPVGATALELVLLAARTTAELERSAVKALKSIVGRMVGVGE